MGKYEKRRYISGLIIGILGAILLYFNPEIWGFMDELMNMMLGILLIVGGVSLIVKTFLKN